MFIVIFLSLDCLQEVARLFKIRLIEIWFRVESFGVQARVKIVVSNKCLSINPVEEKEENI